MHISAMDSVLAVLSMLGEILLLGILIGRRLYRTFPVFTVYMLWQFVSDVLLSPTLFIKHDSLGSMSYALIYYYFLAIADILEIGVLLEIAAIVIGPAKRILQKRIIYSLIGAAFFVGFAAVFIAIYATGVTHDRPRVFLLMDTTAAIVRLAVFLLVAGFSQLLGLNWRNHVLQLATGLGFFAIVVLLAQLFQSRLEAGPMYLIYYHRLGQVEAAGYLCTLYFWCWAFAKKEAPRRDFSPQMARFLASLSGGAKRQNAVLARSRDE